MNLILPKSKILAAFLFFIVFLFGNTAFGQTIGDYRSAATGNWTTLGSWQYFNGSTWATPTGISPQGYPGQYAGTGTVTIRDTYVITLSTSISNSFTSLVIGSGASGELFITNDITVNTKNVSIKASGIMSFDKKSITFPTGTSFSITSPGKLYASNNNCNNGTALYIGSSKVSACTGNGGGALSDFDTFNARGGTGSATSNSPVCTGSTLTLTATPPVATSGGPYTYTYRWSGPSGVNSGYISSTTYSFTANYNNHNGTYTLDILRNDGILSTVSTDVVINPTPANYGVYGGGPICYNSSTPILTTSGVGTVVRWEKKLDSGSYSPIAGTAGLTSFSEIPTAAGTWTYQAVMGSGACPVIYSSPTASVVVNPELTISLASTNLSACQNNSNGTFSYTATTGNANRVYIDFDAAATAAGIQQHQDFGVSSTGGTITIQYTWGTAPGVYNGVITVVKDSPFCKSSITYPVTVTINAPGSVPSITTQPTSPVATCSGSGTQTMTVAATGSGLTYQWRRNYSNITNGAVVSGATSNTLTLTNPTTADAGTYDVVVTGICSSGVQSNAVTVTVNANLSAAPVTPNTSQSICVTASGTTLTATPTGGGTMSYQWGKRSVSGGTITSLGVTTASYTPTGAGLTVGTWLIVCTSTPTCGTAITSNEVTVTVSGTPSTASVGSTQNICATLTTASLGGNTPTVGTGTWSQVSGSGTSSFSAVNSGTSTATASVAGTYVYRWTISNGSCTSSTANVTVNYYATPTAATVGPAQNRCGTLTTASLGGNTPTVGAGTWSQVSGPGTSSFSAVNSGSSTATASVVGTYVYRWTISNGSCTSSTADITVNYYAAPTTASVGSAQNRCASLTTASLGGNTPSVGTGTWSQVSGSGTSSFSAVNSGTSTATASVTGTYVYRWTISNGSCTSNADVTVNYYATPTTAAVGGSQNICASLTTASLGGNTPTVGTGTWSQVNGSGTSSFSAVNSGSSTATASVAGTYVYRWTINNGSCTASTADVTVNYYAAPTTASVGSAQNRCASLTTASLGGNTPTVGAGTWSQVSGSGTSSFSAVNSGTSTATASVAGTYVYRWTISNGSCTASTADITVNYYATPTTATVGGTQNVCASLTTASLGGNTPTVGAGTWSQVSGSGTSSFSAVNSGSSTATASVAGTYVYRWTISNGSCTASTADVTVNYYANPTANAGGVLTTICQGGTSAAMGGSFGGGATGSTWTGGAGVWANANNPSTATYTAATGESGNIILTLTASSVSCGNATATKTITVNPSPTLTTATQSIFACYSSSAAINLTGLLAGSTSTITYTIDGISEPTVTGVIADGAGAASFNTRNLISSDDGKQLQITGITVTSASPSCTKSFAGVAGIDITLNVKPDSGGISLNGGTPIASPGTATFSELTTATFSIAAIPGAASYTWFVPAGWTNLTGQGTREITVTTGVESPSSSNSISVTATNSNNTFFCPSYLGVTLTSIAPAAPVPTIIIPVKCNALGSIELNNLPSGSWTLNVTKNGNPISTPFPGTGNTYTLGSLSEGSYTFTVSNQFGMSAATATVVVDRVTKTWNGSGWYSGSNPSAAPTADEDVEFISGNYNSSVSVNACSCTVKSGANVAIGTGKVLNIMNGLTVETGGILTFENGASLIQNNDFKNVNTGKIIYKRTTSAVKDFDYVYWSSPVVGQTLGALSPLSDKYWSWTSSGWFQEGGSRTMLEGKGYLARVPRNVSSQDVEFIGTPNNGDVSIAALGAGKSNLMGNPYPSAIDADMFLIDNASIIDDFPVLRLWTHNTARKVNGDGTQMIYTAGDYAYYTIGGGTAAYPGTVKPDGTIGAGQGFMVISENAGTFFNFTNSMRIGDEGGNSQFYKQAGTKKKAKIQKNRVWLNLTNSDGAFKQLLVGYITGATNDLDRLYDGTSVGGDVDFYSIASTKKLTIQSRGLPFDNADEVPLGYKTTIEGTFEITIDETDGFFVNQAVYLEDKTTNTIHDLRKSSYSFATAIGTFDDRFVLRYTNTSKLGTGDFNPKGKGVIVSVKNKQIKINSFDQPLASVKVYDLKGSLLYEKNKVNKNEFIIDTLTASDQFMIVMVQLEDGKWVSEEIIFHD